MVASTAARRWSQLALMSGPLLLLLVTSQPTVRVSATKQEAPPPPSEQSTAALSADDISRPAVSVWSYTAQPDALDFMKAGASPGNTSWTDFFLGGGVCAGGDGAEKTNSGATPCDPAVETTKAVKSLGIPALYTVRHLFFKDRRDYPNFPTIDPAGRGELDCV